jgi:hypothetical protein
MSMKTPMISTTIVENIIETKFLSAEKFSLDIETYVKENKCDYIEAIISYCDENNIEVETVPKLLSKPLKERLKFNAEKLNFLKKTSKSTTKSLI